MRRVTSGSNIQENFPWSSIGLCFSGISAHDCNNTEEYYNKKMKEDKEHEKESSEIFISFNFSCCFNVPYYVCINAGCKVKTPGKVTITRVRLAGSSKVTVCWKKAKMLQTTGFIISRLVPDPGKELQL